MPNPRGRPVVYDHKNIPHKQIAFPRERRDAVARAAATIGVSSHVLIQRWISAGLAVFGEDACDS